MGAKVRPNADLEEKSREKGLAVWGHGGQDQEKYMCFPQGRKPRTSVTLPCVQEDMYAIGLWIRRGDPRVAQENAKQAAARAVARAKEGASPFGGR